MDVCVSSWYTSLEVCMRISAEDPQILNKKALVTSKLPFEVGEY